MKLIEIVPGVSTPRRSNGDPVGSVTLTRAVIVPLCAIEALATLNTNPGLTNCTIAGSTALAGLSSRLK
jgi:hypothetical protein